MLLCFDTGEQFRVQAVQDLLRHQAEEPAARLSQEPQNPQSILQRLQAEVSLLSHCERYIKTYSILQKPDHLLKHKPHKALETFFDCVDLPTSLECLNCYLTLATSSGRF